jgi:hypothetical protein
MAATSGQQYGVGMKHARIYALADVAGVLVPAATSETVYEGIQLVAARALELTVPEARRITHQGDDTIKAQDWLPRIEPSSAVLRAGRNDYDLLEIITGNKKVTIGESVWTTYGTDNEDTPPNIAIHSYQQSLDATSKARRYRSILMPVSQARTAPSSMNENPAEYTYQVLPQRVSRKLWGIALSVATDGASEGEFFEGMFEDFPHVVAWKASTATEFNFHADRPATATTKIHVVTTISTAGVVTDVTGTVTKAVDGVTFGAAPDAGTYIVCAYEYAD